MKKTTNTGAPTTVAVTPDFMELYSTLKAQGYGFATVSAIAVREAIEANMPVPASTRTKGFIKDERIYLGAVIPYDLVHKLNQLTKPTGAKQAYIREAIKLWASKNLKD